MEDQFFIVVKELGFPIAVGGTLLVGAIAMVWFLVRNMFNQIKEQRQDLLAQRESDRQLTKEVVQHISTTGTHLKNIGDFMSDINKNAQETLQQLRENMARQDERHTTNVQAVQEFTQNQRTMMKQWESVFQGIGDARQSIQIADAHDRNKGKVKGVTS